MLVGQVQQAYEAEMDGQVLQSPGAATIVDAGNDVLHEATAPHQTTVAASAACTKVQSIHVVLHGGLYSARTWKRSGARGCWPPSARMVRHSVCFNARTSTCSTGEHFSLQDIHTASISRQLELGMAGCRVTEMLWPSATHPAGLQTCLEARA